jgi:spore cortex biosynthesis protein YabQ
MGGASMEDVLQQVRVLGVMFAAGWCIGILFDIHRVARGLVRPGLVAGIVGDLAFWCVATAVGAAALLLANWGELRLVPAVAMGAGFGCYRRTISPGVVGLLAQFGRLPRRLSGRLH